MKTTRVLRRAALAGASLLLLAGCKSSTSGHLMPRHFLLEAKIDPEKDFDGAPVFSGAHDATVKLVESGKVDAGALDMQVWQRMNDKKQFDATKVALFWTTPPFA